MIDPNEREAAALRSAMKAMGEAMGEIGWTTRLGDLTAEQAGRLAEAAVDGFQEAMRDSAPEASDPEIPF